MHLESKVPQTSSCVKYCKSNGKKERKKWQQKSYPTKNDDEVNSRSGWVCMYPMCPRSPADIREVAWSTLKRGNPHPAGISGKRRLDDSPAWQEAYCKEDDILLRYEVKPISLDQINCHGFRQGHSSSGLQSTRMRSRVWQRKQTGW